MIKPKEFSEAKEIKKVGNFLVIDGVWYEPSYSRGKKEEEHLKFKKVDKKKVETLLNELSESLSKDVKSKDIIKNALADLRVLDLVKIAKALKKKKVEKKQRYGCYELIVGKEIIPIR